MHRPLRIRIEPGSPVRRLFIGDVAQSSGDCSGLAEMAGAGSAITALSLRERPAARDALVVGVGLGGDVRRLRSRGLRVLAAEIDPTIARLARAGGAGPVAIGNGRDVWRAALERGASFDLVLLDACTAPGAPPSELWTPAACAELERLVAPRRGAVLVRVIASPGSAAVQEVARRFRERFALTEALREGIGTEVQSIVLCFAKARSAPAASPDRPPASRSALLAAALLAASCGPTPARNAGPITSASAPAAAAPAAPIALKGCASAGPGEAPPGSPPICLVGFLRKEGEDLVVYRISNEFIAMRYVLKGPAAEPLRAQARAFHDEDEEQQTADFRRGLCSGWGSIPGDFHHLSPVVVSLEGVDAPRTQRPPQGSLAGFDGELTVTRVHFAEAATALVSRRAPKGAQCGGPRPPLWDATDALDGESVGPMRSVTVFGYLSRGPDGRHFLDVPHADMGGMRFIAFGAALAKLKAGPFYTQGDTESDATRGQMRTTLAELVGGGGYKRSELRFSSVAVLARGRARYLTRIEPDDFEKGPDGRVRHRNAHADLPEGGELFEMDVDSIDWSMDRPAYDAFLQREVKPRVARMKAAAAARKPAELLAAFDEIAEAYLHVLPVPLNLEEPSGLVTWMSMQKALRARPAKDAVDAPLHTAAVVIAMVVNVYSGWRAVFGMYDVLAEYAALELERIWADKSLPAAVRERAAGLTLGFSEGLLPVTPEPTSDPETSEELEARLEKQKPHPLVARLKPIADEAHGKSVSFMDVMGGW